MLRERDIANNKRRAPAALPIVVTALALGMITLAVGSYHYRWSWTGFAGKTLWDWMTLLVIPGVLGAAALWLNQRLETQRREIENNHFEQDVLQNYFDRMSDLIAKEKLRNSDRKSEIRHVAWAHTRAALRVLSSDRKGLMIRFLHDCGLIDRNNPVISLSGADLRSINLKRAKLHNIDLHGADLRGARLQYATQDEADLRGPTKLVTEMGYEIPTDLGGADLQGAVLFEARLDGATLTRACLVRTVLQGAELVDADLRGADLRGSDLSGTYEGDPTPRLAWPTAANLTGANLTDANLAEADLSGVNLTGATVTDEQLGKAKSLRGATMPHFSTSDRASQGYEDA
jgi:uncharacterized protein YjbI with pentapeptide repeats